MKQQLFRTLLFTAVVALMLCISICAATTSEDISTEISNAADGETVNITLENDIEIASKIVINKAITVNINFNGCQLKYTDTGNDVNNAIFELNNAGAILNLNGSHKLESYKTYTHYDESVKADMTGESNLVVIYHGSLNIESMYMNVTGDAWAVNAPIAANNDTVITVKNSVIRVPEGSNKSAFRSEGRKVYIKELVQRIIQIDNSVVYEGFKGGYSDDAKCAFNYTVGSYVTGVKFYNFSIENDSWYDAGNTNIAPLLMNSYEKAFTFTDCVFSDYDETEATSINYESATGKTRIKFVRCTSFETINGTLSKDNGGDCIIYVVIKEPTCSESGSSVVYTNSTTGEEKETTISHTYELKILYEDGYMNRGKGKNICVTCEYAYTTSTTYFPIFTDLGFSVSNDGKSITHGTSMDRDAYNLFVQNRPDITLEYGFVAGVESVEVTSENGSVVVTNGYKLDCSANLDDGNGNIFGGGVFNLKLINIDTDAERAFKIVMEFYIYDGESISYADEERTVTSYNEVVAALNAANGSVMVENFESGDCSFSYQGYDNASLTGGVTLNRVVNAGEDGSYALEITRDTSNKNFEVHVSFAEEKYIIVEDNEYMIVWIDFTQVEFRKACFGFIVKDGETTVIYRTDDYDSSVPFYYMEDGSVVWKELYQGNDGCFGSGDSGSQGVNGMKGYFAIPLSYFKNKNLGQTISAGDTVAGLYFYGDISSSSYVNKPFYIDSIYLVKDYKTFQK